MLGSGQCHRSDALLSNDTPPTEIYTLSLHDALPISPPISTGTAPPPSPCSRTPDSDGSFFPVCGRDLRSPVPRIVRQRRRDRKSTRLNSSHGYISYAVFCLKKKKEALRNDLLADPSI